MGQIATTDAFGLYTKKLTDVFVERIKPMSFLRSFFKEHESTTKELALEVQRTTEPVAVDVVRGTDGNRNQWSRSSEKMFVPPYFREYFDLTQLQLYDRLFAATTVDDRMFAQLLNESATKLEALKDKIDRAVELYCSNVFETGIVSLQAATSIDYKRKAAMLVTLAGGDLWTAGGAAIFTQFQTWCKLLRTTGKVSSFEFNCIMGEDAHAAFMGNSTIVNRQDIFNMQLDRIQAPQKNSTGGVYHGTITAGPYRVNIWTYPDYYQNSAGTMVPYWPAKKIALIPTVGFSFNLWYAAVPQLLKPGQPIQTGKYIVSEYTDEKAKTHEIHLESAPLPIPTTVDQIFTAQVVA